MTKSCQNDKILWYILKLTYIHTILIKINFEQSKVVK